MPSQLGVEDAANTKGDMARAELLWDNAGLDAVTWTLLKLASAGAIAADPYCNPVGRLPIRRVGYFWMV